VGGEKISTTQSIEKEVLPTEQQRKGKGGDLKSLERSPPMGKEREEKRPETKVYRCRGKAVPKGGPGETLGKGRGDSSIRRAGEKAGHRNHNRQRSPKKKQWATNCASGWDGGETSLLRERLEKEWSIHPKPNQKRKTGFLFPE